MRVHTLDLARLPATLPGDGVIVLRDGPVVVHQLRAPADPAKVEAIRRRQSLRAALRERLVAGPAGTTSAAVSVVVRPAPGLERCLQSVEALDPPAAEVLVADGPVTARGRFVAFTDGDCVVEPQWLADLDMAFADPLVDAIVGYTGPSRHDGAVEPAAIDLFALSPFELEPNTIARAAALPFDAGTLLRGGRRILRDPSRVVWRRRRPRRRWRPPHVTPAPAPQRTPARVDVEHAGLPELTVAIASYQRRDALRATLEALAGQRYRDGAWEAVVVLDGSTDGSAEMARQLELPYSLRVVEQANRGPAAARNRGADAAERPIVVFLDDDIRPAPGFLAAHGRTHADAAARGIVLGPCPPVIGGQSTAALLLRNWWSDHYRRQARPDHRWSFVDICSGNASLPVAAFRSLGGLDEDFAGGHRREDWEFGVRVIGARVPVTLCADAHANHHLDTSLDTMLRGARAEARSDVMLAAKHPSVTAALPLAAYTAEQWDAQPRWPAATRRLVLPALDRAAPLRWLGPYGRAWRAQYARGLRDALPGDGALRALLDPATWEFDELALALAEPERPLPETVARPERVHVDGVVVRAIDPGAQWDAVALAERILTELTCAA